MAATELKEYSAGDKKISPSPVDDVDEDSFAIDDEEPALEANDHKPVAEDVPASPLNPFPRFTGSEKSSIENDTPDTKSVQESTHITPSPATSTVQPATSTPAPTLTSTPTPTPIPTPIAPISAKTTTPNSSLPSTPNGSPKAAHSTRQALKTSSQLTPSGGIPTGSASPENERMVLSYNERLKMYEDVLQADVLEIHLLRELAWQGIPESKGLRALYWKILLHYLPNNKALWEANLARDRKLYKDWVNELVIDPHQKNVNHSDHPLSLEQDSRWNAFFKDNEILAEIDKDVKRTFPHLHFFNQISPTGQTIESEHYHVLKRILFIYAKLNPGIRYVQEHAEADAFFCFTNLMSEWRDNFCKTLDKSEIGVVGNMKRLNMLFKDQDLELWNDLEDKKMNPQFYSFRWITLLLSQEFELPDVLRLWDSLFADAERFSFFYCFCCAMLICVRERILNGTFADNLKLLQSYPPIDFQVIFATALKMHENTYEPPPPRKKAETSAHTTPYTHTSVSVHAPTPTPTSSTSSNSTTSSKLSSLFTKSSPSSSPTVTKEKPQETKPNSIFNIMGKFKM